MITLVQSILDSTPFKLFFAAWTGVYLVQLLYGHRTRNEWAVMGVFFVAALFILSNKSEAS